VRSPTPANTEKPPAAAAAPAVMHVSLAESTQQAHQKRSIELGTAQPEPNRGPTQLHVTFTCHINNTHICNIT
jgi:hypothetical protein